MQKYDKKFMETRFHQQEHDDDESKIRLLKIHPHISERLDNEADKRNAKKKGKIKEAYSQGTGKTSKKTTAISSETGGGESISRRKKR